MNKLSQTGLIIFIPAFIITIIATILFLFFNYSNTLVILCYMIGRPVTTIAAFMMFFGVLLEDDVDTAVSTDKESLQ